MVTSETKIRVRYGETDKMGYIYHANYVHYFDIGRTELMREQGLTYATLEEKGIILPVRSLIVNYIRPGFYDQELTLKTYLKTPPTVKLKFEYELFNPENELMSTGEVTLAFLDNITRKPVKPPTIFLEKVHKFFN